MRYELRDRDLFPLRILGGIPGPATRTAVEAIDLHAGYQLAVAEEFDWPEDVKEKLSRAEETATMPSPTQRPSRKHHHIPRFLLRRWSDPTDDQGRVWRYRYLPGDRLEERLVGVGGAAWQEELYSVRPALPFLGRGPVDQIERNVLAPIDDAAAKTLALIESGGLTSLGASERTAWATFLNSLLERGPHVLRPRDRLARRRGEEIVARFLQQPREADAQLHADDALRRLDIDALAASTVRTHMVRAIRDSEVVNYFAGMRWYIFRVAPPFRGFLVSDNPLVVNIGAASRPIYSLSLAVSPSDLFVAWNDDADLEGQFPPAFVLAHSLTVIEQATAEVYASTRLGNDGPIRMRTAIETQLARWATTE